MGLAQVEQILLNAKCLIVVDEAGMVGVRDMVAVLDIAKAAGAKVILIGDALRVIAKAIGSTRLDAPGRRRGTAPGACGPIPV